MKIKDVKSFDICGLNFKIVYRDRNSRNDGNMGNCDTKDLVIFIDKDMPDENIEATIVHEWIHAVLGTNGIEHHELIASVLGAELYRCGFKPWRK